jgi:hypothetical protein
MTTPDVASPEPEGPAALITLGTQIAEVGMKLAQIRKQRDELSTQVSALELELMPLLQKHGALLAIIVGAAMPAPVPQAPAPVPQPQPMAPPAGLPNPGGDQNAGLKQRIRMFLKNVDESVSALEIAEAIKVDASVVREVLLDMRNAR